MFTRLVVIVKKILPLLKQEKVSSFYQSEFVFINFFLLPSKIFQMLILILLPLDGHNFKIITQILQNNILFMKTVNQDLVSREFSLLIRWKIRVIYRNWGRKFCPPSFSRDTDIHNISLLISVPTILGFMCVKSVKYLKFRFS